VRVLRRVIAGLFIAASVLSGVAWIASYWRPYKTAVRADLAMRGGWLIGLREGRFDIGVVKIQEVPVGTPVVPWLTRTLGPYHYIGFENELSDLRPLYTKFRNALFPPMQSQVRRARFDGIVVSIWGVLTPLVILSGLLVLPDVRQFLTQRARRRRGACLNCGYDLTGNLSGQCSECGMHFEQDECKEAGEEGGSVRMRRGGAS